MSDERRNYSSGTRWEPFVGYSRAVRVGPHIYVAGTTATDESGAVVPGGTYEQTRQVLANIKRALEGLGGAIEHVVRTRIYVINIDEWEEIGRAHGEYFGSVRPASTMVEVSRLVAPEMAVEIEAEAIVPADSA